MFSPIRITKHPRWAKREKTFLFSTHYLLKPTPRTWLWQLFGVQRSSISIILEGQFSTSFPSVHGKFHFHDRSSQQGLQVGRVHHLTHRQIQLRILLHHTNHFSCTPWHDKDEETLENSVMTIFKSDYCVLLRTLHTFSHFLLRTTLRALF